MVKYYLTQNIDNLESKAGFRPDDIVHAHGANVGATCAGYDPDDGSRCNEKADPQELRECIKDAKVLRCKVCDKPIKPDIYFYGEGFPQKFLDVLETFAANPCDLLIIMGSNLGIAPFNRIVDEAGKCPKVLINPKNTADRGWQFKDPVDYPRHLMLEGQVDEKIKELVRDCGWEKEFAERTAKCKNPNEIDEL